MAGYQSLTLVGNVGADPKTEDTQWGPVTNFDIAVNGRNNPPIWYSVAAWGKLGEAAAQYLSKGREILIESNQFWPEWWPDKNGTIAMRINVKASRIIFLDGGAPELKRQLPKHQHNGNRQQSRQQVHQQSHNGNRQQRQHNGQQQHQRQQQPARQPLKDTGQQQQAEEWNYEQIADEVPF